MIIIDGHNLLFSIQKSFEESESVTPAVLCRMIDAYLRQVDEAGCLVFDGTGPPDREIFENMMKLEVIFSGRTKDADRVIEDKIAANTAPRRLVVVRMTAGFAPPREKEERRPSRPRPSGGMSYPG